MHEEDFTKKESPKVLRIKLVQLTIFLLIQSIFLPITIIGYFFIVFKALVYSKKLDVLVTATNPLIARWILHKFGLREDEDGTKMISSLPIISPAGLWLMMGPSIIANRICGYVPTFARVPEPEKANFLSFLNYRTEFFDNVMEKNIDVMDQVVFMGAGFDTRAFMYCRGKNIKVFELDKENIQNCKIGALKKAKIDYDWIIFVPIDFNRESWADKLIEHSFDSSKRTFFLWEGVTPYLEEETVKRTLRALAKSGGKGSIVAFDFYSIAFITGEGSFIMKYYANQLLKMTGASMKFGIDTTFNTKENVEALLNESGLALEKLSLMGKITEKEKPFGGLIEAAIKK